MNSNALLGRKQNRRAAAVVVVLAVSAVALCGFAALAIDLGYMYAIRGDLQRSADAAALGAASAFVSDAGLSQSSTLEATLIERAHFLSENNPTFGTPVLLADSDVVYGSYNYTDRDAPFDSGGGRIDSVRVTARRTPGSPNGPVQYFIPLVGNGLGSVVASATAVANDHFAGINTPCGLAYLVSFEQGGDDGDDDDGDDDGESDGTTEFGAVYESSLDEQFAAGYQAFFDDDGNAVEHPVAGTSDAPDAMFSALEDHVGDVVGFFLHSFENGDGAEKAYTVVGIRFGRVMDVSASHITIQPVVFTSSKIVIDNDAPSSNGQVVRVVLVR